MPFTEVTAPVRKLRLLSHMHSIITGSVVRELPLHQSFSLRRLAFNLSSMQILSIHYRDLNDLTGKLFSEG
jgi:hypothetical protein